MPTEDAPQSAECLIAERIRFCYDLHPVCADDTAEAVEDEVRPFVRAAEQAVAAKAREPLEREIERLKEEVYQARNEGAYWSDRMEALKTRVNTLEYDNSGLRDLSRAANARGKAEAREEALKECAEVAKNCWPDDIPRDDEKRPLGYHDGAHWKSLEIAAAIRALGEREEG